MLLNPLFWLILLIAVPLYWLLPDRWRTSFLSVVSFAFLFHLAPLSVSWLLFWSLIFYWAAPWMHRDVRGRSWVVTGLIFAIVGFLAYFKYIPSLLLTLRGGPLDVEALLVPLGISYYTFKLIHYAAEVARGNITDRSLGRFLCYMYLFPIFTAGPIERFDHFLENRESRWDYNSMVEGLTRILYGLIKKFCLAEWVLARYIDKLDVQDITGGMVSADIFDKLPELSMGTVWTYLALRWLYFYMDFSAYTDIALGASRLFGYRIMENFNWPILATSMGNFWKRWHMTLSGWCQAYVYMPILGLTRRPTLALYLAFLVFGLWHAGTMLRILWALWHATGVLIYMTWTRRYRRNRWTFFDGLLGSGIGWVITQGYVVVSMAFLLGGDRNAFGTVRVLCKLVGYDLPPLY